MHVVSNTEMGGVLEREEMKWENKGFVGCHNGGSIPKSCTWSMQRAAVVPASRFMSLDKGFSCCFHNFAVVGK